MDTKLVSGKLSSSQRVFNDSSSGMASEDQLKQLETKVMTKMAESVEELATIIKEYAKKNKRFNDRISDLEIKIYGQAREGAGKS